MTSKKRKSTERAKYAARPLIRSISFFGDALLPKTSHVYKEAFEVAKLLAEKGYTIVDGGGPGVMDAATSGAEAGGGETLAITFSPKDAPGFEGRYVGNVADKEIVTANYIERMFKLMEHGDAYIIFRGGSGTLSEFGTAWVLAKLYYGHHRPFILFGKGWIEIIDAIRRYMNIDAQEMSVFEIVEKPDKVLDVIARFEKRMRLYKN